jgi:hypothetical protein
MNESIRNLPKLRVDWSNYGRREEEVFDLEQAEERIFAYARGIAVAIEGELITSYEDLLEVVREERFRNRPEIKVKPFPAMLAGG